MKEVWNSNGFFQTKGVLRAIDGDVLECHKVLGPSAVWMLEFEHQVNLSAVKVYLREGTPRDVLDTIEVSFGRIDDPSDLLSGLAKVWTARAKEKLPLVLTFDLPPSLTNWSIVMVERTTADPLRFCEVTFENENGEPITLEYNSPDEDPRNRAGVGQCSLSKKATGPYSDAFFKAEITTIDRIVEDCVFVSASFGKTDVIPAAIPPQSHRCDQLYFTKHTNALAIQGHKPNGWRVEVFPYYLEDSRLSLGSSSLHKEKFFKMMYWRLVAPNRQVRHLDRPHHRHHQPGSGVAICMVA